MTIVTISDYSRSDGVQPRNTSRQTSWWTDSPKTSWRIKFSITHSSVTKIQDGPLGEKYERYSNIQRCPSMHSNQYMDRFVSQFPDYKTQREEIQTRTELFMSGHPRTASPQNMDETLPWILWCQNRTQVSSYNYDGEILYDNPHIFCQLLQSPTSSWIPASRPSARDGLGLWRGEDTELIVASRVEENCLLSIDINVARLVAKDSRRNNN